jgi:hypothetical protein
MQATSSVMDTKRRQHASPKALLPPEDMAKLLGAEFCAALLEEAIMAIPLPGGTDGPQQAE